MIVAGFGFRGAATADSLRDALNQAAGGRAVVALAAPADKADAPCLRELAQSLGVPATPVSDADVQGAPTLTHAPRVIAARGAGSVAEAAALAAARALFGDRAALFGPRCLSADRMAACAVAGAPDFTPDVAREDDGDKT